MLTAEDVTMHDPACRYSPQPRTAERVESPGRLEESRQQERFNWFVERLQPFIGRHAVTDLLETISAAPEWRGQREKAIVLLALDRSAVALAALRSLDTGAMPDSTKRLYAVALAEAEKRR